MPKPKKIKFIIAGLLSLILSSMGVFSNYISAQTSPSTEESITDSSSTEPEAVSSTDESINDSVSSTSEIIDTSASATDSGIATSTDESTTPPIYEIPAPTGKTSTTTVTTKDLTPTKATPIATSTPVTDSQPIVRKIYSPILGGTFHSGVIPIIVVFNKAVIVSGNPKLILSVGADSTTAVPLKFASGNQLYFLYHIVSGDSTTLLDYNSSSAIDLSDATIKDADGNDATLTLPEAGSAGSLSKTSKIEIKNL